MDLRPGSGAWRELNVEDVLTTIELEFGSADSDGTSRLVIIKNKVDSITLENTAVGQFET